MSTRPDADATTVLLLMIVDDVIKIIINNEIKDRKVGTTHSGGSRYYALGMSEAGTRTIVLCTNMI